jgi:hypothetical protein
MSEQRNGGYLGARNLPQAAKAGGIWQADEVYNACRDAVWPRWPGNIGIPFDDRLRVWVEHDYGLYQDVDATVPVTANLQNVRSWVNRGNSGRLVCNLPVPPVRAYAVQADGVAFYASQLRHFDPQIVDRRAYNYVFTVDFVASTNARAKITNSLCANEIATSMRSAPALTSGSTIAAAGKNDTSWLVLPAPSSSALNIFGQLSSVNLTAGQSLVGSSGASIVTAEPLVVTPGPAEITIGGAKNVVAPSSLMTLFAMIWYSSDTPMTNAELNLVYAYLGAKYSRPFPVLA